MFPGTIHTFHAMSRWSGAEPQYNTAHHTLCHVPATSRPPQHKPHTILIICKMKSVMTGMVSAGPETCPPPLFVVHSLVAFSKLLFTPSPCPATSDTVKQDTMSKHCGMIFLECFASLFRSHTHLIRNHIKCSSLTKLNRSCLTVQTPAVKPILHLGPNVVRHHSSAREIVNLSTRVSYGRVVVNTRST